jgi:hypothetical protein
MRAHEPMFDLCKYVIRRMLIGTQPPGANRVPLFLLPPIDPQTTADRQSTSPIITQG